MEEVCERENLKAALRQVKANKGSPGVDGMTVGGIKDYLKQHWPAIREQLLNGTYEPKPVRRVEIPKPAGGVRKLGIPTVLDRFIQQAVMQVLQRRWDRTFSDHSYGFRPGRSAHQAVAQAQQYIAVGHGWWGYCRLAEDRKPIFRLEGWIRRHIRKCFWLRWHNGQGRAHQWAGSRLRPTSCRSRRGRPSSNHPATSRRGSCNPR
jgi:hypothetical protein